MFLLFSIAIFTLFIWGGHFKKEGNADYLGKDQANAIKGFFILFLTIGHIMYALAKYDLYPLALGDKLERMIHWSVGQLDVVMFLFFSGYGVAESIRKDSDGKRGYLRFFPKKRVLKTYINYAVGISIFLLFSPLTGKIVQWDKIHEYYLFLAEGQLGAPTWYIFIIIVCYILTWVVASIFKKSRLMRVSMLSISLMAVALILSLYKDTYWYNTMFAYAYGYAFSEYRGKLESIYSRSWLIYLIISVLCFILLYNVQNRMPHLISHNLLSVFFATVIILISYKFKFGNKLINWCGSHLFPIYMYQGLFYYLLLNIGGEKHILASWSPFLYALLSVIITLVFARYYHYIEIKMK